ncbi:MAG: Trk system potassium transporter TrkA [Gammaproteobacteria bacterium]|jgi:trk system potassium uptake protein TrkA
MKILILGAGTVGSTAAESLSDENEITVVDLNGRLLAELQDRLDIRTVQGHASHPRVLEKAGAADADILVALTDSDETNMVACQIAFSIYRTPVRIARIRAAEYTSRQELFGAKAVPVDTIISPEQLVTEHIEQLIHYPGAHQVLDFADGRVRLVGVKAKTGGPLIGQELRELRRHIPHTDARVAAIYRQSSIPPLGNDEPIYETILPEGDTVIRENDLVFFLAARKDIRVMMSELLKLEHPARSIIIAGGGHIGFELARRLENTNRVKVIERDYERARYISERLKHAVVLTGDAVDEKLLQEENIDKVDVFCALTSAEEANILSSFLAKRMGASRVIALINRPSYAKLVENQYVDIAVSPQEITLSALLAKVRGMRLDVGQVHALRSGTAEAIEAVAHGDDKTSRVVGKRVEEIPLPPGATIGAIVRENDVLMAHHDTEILREDHVILFLTDRSQIPAVEKLFQVSVTYT